MLFSRAAFEPTESDLLATEDKPKIAGSSKFAETDDYDDNFPDSIQLFEEGSSSAHAEPRRKPRLSKTKKKRTSRRILDSDEEMEDDDDDLSDFIVQDGEDEEEKDAKRAIKKRLGKRHASSDVDMDSPYASEAEEDNVLDDDVVFGPQKRFTGSSLTDGIKTLSKLLPSTKMLVRTWSLICLPSRI